MINKALLERLEELEEKIEELTIQNKLLKSDLEDRDNLIKKGVKEQYKEFMVDYDILLEEYNQLYVSWDLMKSAIEILKDKGISPYQSRLTSKYKYLSVGIEDLIDLTEGEYRVLKEVFE